VLSLVEALLGFFNRMEDRRSKIAILRPSSILHLLSSACKLMEVTDARGLEWHLDLAVVF
jgi:hypothetical protein